jgi:hypothetical protein
MDHAVLRPEVHLEALDLQRGVRHLGPDPALLGVERLTQAVAHQEDGEDEDDEEEDRERKKTGKTKSHHSVVAESCPWSTRRPRDTLGGWTPNPRKDSVDSKMMDSATVRVAFTMIGPTAFGSMCLTMMRRFVAPSARDASTKSRSRSDRKSARTNRAT